jgi:Ca2+/H+ antiporter
MLKMLLGPVADLASGYLQNKAEEKKLRHQAKMQVIANGAEWESKMADASSSSWKDEFWTLVLAAPVFMIGYAIAMDDVAVIERVDLAFRCSQYLAGVVPVLIVFSSERELRYSRR